MLLLLSMQKTAAVILLYRYGCLRSDQSSLLSIQNRKEEFLNFMINVQGKRHSGGSLLNRLMIKDAKKYLRIKLYCVKFFEFLGKRYLKNQGNFY